MGKMNKRRVKGKIVIYNPAKRKGGQGGYRRRMVSKE